MLVKPISLDTIQLYSKYFGEQVRKYFYYKILCFSKTFF